MALVDLSQAIELIESSPVYETVPKSFYDSSLVEVLTEVGASAWCFIPEEPSKHACCSVAFRDLWKLPADVAHTSGAVLNDMFAGALEATGISKEEFLQRVAGHISEFPDSITLLLKDKTRIQVLVRCVFSQFSSEIVGRVLQFRVTTEINAISGLLDQISAARRRLEILSNREMEILNLVYEGRTNKAISIATGISEKTVEKHRSRIMLKLGLSCTTMMIRIITLARMLPGTQSVVTDD